VPNRHESPTLRDILLTLIVYDSLRALSTWNLGADILPSLKKPKTGEPGDRTGIEQKETTLNDRLQGRWIRVFSKFFGGDGGGEAHFRPKNQGVTN
jgi:hypothetical protein